MVNEFVKRAWNSGQEGERYFWRDSQGNEIDLLLYDEGHEATAYEVKSGATFNADFFNGLTKWASLSGASPERLNVVYGGEASLSTSKGKLLAWQRM